jgi:anti-sigma B factor antagonist
MDPVFDIDRSQVDGHARVRFVGELDRAAVEQAHAEVIEVLDKTAGALTVDLSRLTFCDASGVSLLLKLDSETKARGRVMVLRNPTPVVHRVFRVLDLVDHLTIEDGVRCQIETRVQAVSTGLPASRRNRGAVL